MDQEQLTFANFVLNLLNSEGFRSEISQELPLISKLENLEGLKDLKLVEATLGKYNSSLILRYEAIGGESVYPDTLEKLVKAGIVQKKNVLFASGAVGPGVRECESIRFGYENNKIHILLTVYKD